MTQIEFVKICVNQWLRLQGLEIADASAPLTEAPPCNLKARLIDSSGKQSAGQEDYAEQDVNAMIGLA